MRGGFRRAVMFALGASVLAHARFAQAWDPATTQAGLTEKAASASALNGVLVKRLGRSLGLWEPLSLASAELDASARRGLFGRLATLDPAQGYRPAGVEGDTARAPALQWLLAGAVLAETPAERGRHHFFNPRTGRGLDDSGVGAGFFHAVTLALDGGVGVRALATGTAFDLTGRPAPEWLTSPDNDQGLVTFYDQMDASVSAVTARAREAALVRALIAAGGVVALLEDMGEPAHVRNDFRAAYSASTGHGGPWDRVSAFEHWVAESRGRTGIPDPAPVVRRPNLAAFFSAPDGEGLADRTQRRFFSPGTIPADVAIDATSTPRDVLRAARRGLVLPVPRLPRLELREPGVRHHVLIEGHRALAYERLPGRVHFFLDREVFEDSAQALLPEVGAYAAGLLDHLFRGGVVFSVDGPRVLVRLTGVAPRAGAARLRVFAEDETGVRRELTAAVVGGEAEGAPVLAFDLPAGARKLAGVARGSDAAGDFVAAGESTTGR